MQSQLTSRIFKILMYIALSLWAMTTIFPLAWVVLNSFKTTKQIIDNAFSLPTHLVLENYQLAFQRNILRGYGNSMIISGSVVIMVLLFGSMCAYAIARYEFKAKNALVALITASMLIPIFGTILPVFELLLKMNLFNKRIGLILPQIAGNLAFAILVLKSFMVTIPYEMEEAAQMEGAHVLQIFTHIILPLSKPAMATSAIFVFLWSYNDLFTSLVIMRTRDKMPINVMLTDISSQYGTNYGLMAATIAIIVIPILLVYVVLQRQVIEGMTSGAVKG